MIRIGLAGIGFMGMIHYLAAQKIKGAKVTAISSRDPKNSQGTGADPRQFRPRRHPNEPLSSKKI